jgi:Multicopper oxidase
MRVHATIGYLGAVALSLAMAMPAAGQSFRVQCPASTITHPVAATKEPAYTGPTQFATGPAGWAVPTATTVNGAIKCQQVSGGDGYSTMADGTQTFMFSFGPLSGLADVAAGRPGTQFPNVFNTTYPGTLVPGDPANTDGATAGNSPWTGYVQGQPPPALAFTYNGAVGLAPDVVQTVAITDLVAGTLPAGASLSTCPAPTANTVTVFVIEPLGLPVGTQVNINQAPNIFGATPIPTQFLGMFAVTCVDNNAVGPPVAAGTAGATQFAFQITNPGAAGQGVQTELNGPTAATPPALDGHVDPRQIIDVGVMNGNIPGPLVAFDEDDEMFLTLTNVGMIMRPDLFEQHTIHFHGYPNASSFYDGVPDASVAINIGASFTYYYLAPDAGTYFWHCHITPPEHLQMGMVSQLHVRPRQDRVPAGGNLYTYLGYQNGVGLPAGTVADLRTACNPGQDILCSATMPAVNTGAVEGNDLLGNSQRYTYNDGDGSTAYDVEYPIQMHGFDPNFHFVGMTFNPEAFVDMKDKYFLLNGRSYPDTVAPGPQASMTSDGQLHYSQPMPTIINIPVGGKALLRMVNLSVTEYHTLQSVGVPMKEVGFNAKLLRDQAGMNTEFYTNSITLGGGESLDVILDASDAGCGSANCAAALYPAGSVFYLYTPQLDHLSNDAENFGGLMTEVHICNSVTGGNTYGNTCN